MTTTDFELVRASAAATALALASTYEGATTALTAFARAAEQVPVGDGPEEYRRGAEEMRDFLVSAARKMAADFRGSAPTGRGRR
ncbi:hypothetical protein J0H58_36860 [bacterium]|nr:hypothetical protein [bacterium]